ncbi:uncharacterized protein LOC144716143 isoform X2 [Wolffia australiana]
MTNLDSSTKVDSPLQIFPKARPKYRTKTARESFIGFGREYVARKDSSIAGVYKRIACLKENRTKRKKDWRARKNSCAQRQVNAQSSDKLPCPNENESILNCPETCNFENGRKELETKSSSDSLSLRSSSDGLCTPSDPFPIENSGQCSAGRISSDAVTCVETPSFQFFAASEDGVNLFVDLGSKPFDWIRSLKDEIRTSKTVTPEIRGLGNAKKSLKKHPAKIVSTNLHGNGSNGSNGSGDDDTPKSSVLTSNKSPAESPFDVVLTSCEAAPNSLEHGTQSCQRNVDTLDTRSFANSVHRFSCNSHIDLNEERNKNYDAHGHPVLEAISSCLQDKVKGSLHQLSASTSDKSPFSLADQGCRVTGFDEHNQVNYGKPATYQPLLQQELGCSTNTELQGTGLMNHQLEQRTSNYVNDFSEMSSSMGNNELETRKKSNKERSG